MKQGGLTHQTNCIITSSDSQTDSRRVVAAIPLLQLQHDLPQTPHLVGAHALAAALGAGAGLATTIEAPHGETLGDVLLVAAHGGREDWFVV
jgi:hypothetical protein